MDLSKRIEEIRLKRNLTVKQASDGLGVPISTYRSYAYGVNLPTSFLLKLFGFYSITPNEFFQIHTKKKPVNAAGRDIIIEFLKETLKEVEASKNDESQ